MINVTCPWCDAPMAIDDDRPLLECTECVILVELAPDPPIELAAAA